MMDERRTKRSRVSKRGMDSMTKRSMDSMTKRSVDSMGNWVSKRMSHQRCWAMNSMSHYGAMDSMS